MSQLNGPEYRNVSHYINFQDDRVSGGFDPEELKRRIHEYKGASQVAQGVIATPEKTIPRTNIKIRYIAADESNPWKYAPGNYLVTNIQPQAFERTKSLETTLANITLLDLGLPQSQSRHIVESTGLTLYPKYQGPNGGVIFQIDFDRTTFDFTQ